MLRKSTKIQFKAVSLLKKITVYMCVATLWNPVIINVAEADTEITSGNISSSDNLKVSQGEAQATGFAKFLAGGQNLLRQGLNAWQNQSLNAAIAMKQAQMMGSLQPPMSTDSIFGKVCPTPAMPIPIPQECEKMSQNLVSANRTQLGFEKALSGAAKAHKRNIDTYLQGSDNPRFGLGCMERFKEGQIRKFKVAKDQLVNLKTKLNAQIDKDKLDLEVHKKELENTHQFLNGGGGDKLVNQANDPNKLFNNKACLNSIDPEKLASNSKGLRGIDEFFTGAGTLRSKAGQFTRDRKVIKKHLKEIIGNFKSKMDEFGVTDEAVRAGGLGSSHLRDFGGIQTIAQEELALFKLRKSKIQQETEFKTTDDPLKQERLLASFKNNYLDNCVSGNDGSGVALSAQQIIDSVVIDESIAGGSAERDIKRALASALSAKGNEDRADHVEQASALRAFTQNPVYKNVKVRYIDSDAKEVFTTPSQLFSQTVSNCEKRYSSDPNGKQKLTEIKSNIGKMSKTDEQFKRDLTDTIYKRIMKCDADTAGKGSNSCSSGTAFKTSDPGFCFPAAEKCAKHVKDCHRKVEKIIKDNERKLARNADKYNAKVKSIIKAQNKTLALVDQLVDQNRALLESITREKGTPAESLLLKTPGPKTLFGVELLGGGSLRSIEELPKKIDEIQKKFDEQIQMAEQKLSQEIEKKKAEIQKVSDQFGKVAESCKVNYDDYMAKLQEHQKTATAAQQKAMDEQRKAHAKISSLCLKTKSALAGENARPACGRTLSGLANDIYKVNVSVDHTLIGVANGIRAHCGESMEGSEDKDSDMPTLVELCKSGKGKLLDASFFKKHKNAKEKLKEKFADNGEETCKKLEEEVYTELGENCVHPGGSEASTSSDTPEQATQAQGEQLLTQGGKKCTCKVDKLGNDVTGYSVKKPGCGMAKSALEHLIKTNRDSQKEKAKQDQTAQNILDDLGNHNIICKEEGDGAKTYKVTGLNIDGATQSFNSVKYEGATLVDADGRKVVEPERTPAENTPPATPAPEETTAVSYDGKFKTPKSKTGKTCSREDYKGAIKDKLAEGDWAEKDKEIKFVIQTTSRGTGEAPAKSLSELGQFDMPSCVGPANGNRQSAGARNLAELDRQQIQAGEDSATVD